MGFLDNYCKSHALPPLDDKVKQRLEQAEKKLDDLIPAKTLKFEEVIAEYHDHVIDLIGRVKAEFSNWKFSWGNLWQTFRFVQGIVLEVVQIVDAISHKIVPPGTDKDREKQIKVEFTTEFTYFIWMIVNPLGDYFNWLPFKKTLEKRIVLWLAGIGAHAAFDFVGNLFADKVAADKLVIMTVGDNTHAFEPKRVVKAIG
jgi:hypothetical protein